MNGPPVVLRGIGHALPTKVVSNDDLAARLDTSDEWIRTRSGIRQRYVSTSATGTSDLAVEAGVAALKSAGVETVDVVVLATSTPDRPCPATAPVVASRMGLRATPAFDLDAVCSGFLYGLATASALVTSGQFGSALLVAADTFSTLIDPDDRATAFLFGDGAAAVVLSPGDAGDPGAVLAVDLGSDGTQQDLITVADRQSSFTMQGQAVYRQAVSAMANATRTVVDRIGWSVDDLDWFVGHQANQRILDAVAARLTLPANKVISNIARVGNTAAASIPLALSEAAASGRLREGDRIALAAYGAGATWGAAAMTWPHLR